MTEAGHVAAEIPHLRRHAHALTGNWSRGDLYTRRVLRASDGDPGAAGQVSSARVGLYRTLHRFWARSGEAAADSVASRCRESMLLSRGAHFSPEEVAEILDLPADTVRGLARRAAAELADAGGRAALFLTDATAEENAATLSLLDACAVRCLGCARTPEAAADGRVRQAGGESRCRLAAVGHAASASAMRDWLASAGASSSAMPSICM